ncbi:MAG: EAL domain-containing protein [Rubrivivax sp.]|nr:EAL domain-containing protein [Rubrivivax sp.]
MPSTLPAQGVSMYGRGLNSIRWRFALASLVLTFAALTGAAWMRGSDGLTDPGRLAIYGGVALLVAAITFAMASKLTAQISSLQRSTEAIAGGDLDAPVDVDCACEVGGLAQSFRKMASRLNANLMRINALAYSDPITGLPNRAVVDRMLAYALAPERKGQFRGAIVFIDLDGFKRVNDTLGHDGGDEMLRLASRRILERGFGRTLETIDSCMDEFGSPCERMPADLVFARFAGDEFVALLPGVTDRTRLSDLGDAVIESLREPFRVKGHEVSVGASLGIAIAPEDTDSAQELLMFADLAMYSSKQAGKSRHMFFDHRVRAAIVEHARIEADLRQALLRHELVVHFQPKIDARTMNLAGTEALVRWQHPERGLLAPGQFIEVAEHAGLMAPLGHQVFELAVQQVRAWLDAGVERAVAVNVSPSQFTDPTFVVTVLDTLRRHAVPPRLVSIEITESLAMSDFEATAERLGHLRGAGVRVAIDDFGIGFSNLSQLSRLPMDELKIDRSLVQDIGRSNKSEAIIRAIVGMTLALGYRPIAEGIETEEQQRFLLQLGCHTMQGFRFGRPMEPQQLEDWVERTQPAAAEA